MEFIIALTKKSAFCKMKKELCKVVIQKGGGFMQSSSHIGSNDIPVPGRRYAKITTEGELLWTKSRMLMRF
jgi:hypothetical protein